MELKWAWSQIKAKSMTYLEDTANKTTYQNQQDTAKAVLREFIVLIFPFFLVYQYQDFSL